MATVGALRLLKVDRFLVSLWKPKRLDKFSMKSTSNISRILFQISCHHRQSAISTDLVVVRITDHHLGTLWFSFLRVISSSCQQYASQISKNSLFVVPLGRAINWISILLRTRRTFRWSLAILRIAPRADELIETLAVKRRLEIFCLLFNFPSI